MDAGAVAPLRSARGRRQGTSRATSDLRAENERIARAYDEVFCDPKPPHALTLAALRMTTRAPDVVLYHEIFSDFSALLCSEIERAVAPYGVSFLTYTRPAPFSVLPTSEQRAVAADVYDGAFGNYRYAVFGRPAAEASPDPRGADVLWSTPLRRRGGSAGYGAPVGYVDNAAGGATVANGLTQAMLDALAGDQRRWPDLLSKGRMMLSSQGPEADDEAAAVVDFLNLWRHQLAHVRAVL